MTRERDFLDHRPDAVPIVGVDRRRLHERRLGESRLFASRIMRRVGVIALGVLTLGARWMIEALAARQRWRKTPPAKLPLGGPHSNGAPKSPEAEPVSEAGIGASS